MRSRSRLGLAFVLGVAGACGSGGSDDAETAELTCDYLSDPSNCWASAASELATCLPAGEVGVLDTGRDQCSFSNGAMVRFDAPLPETTDDLESFAFTIEHDGETCGRFVDTFENRMELEAGSWSVVSELRSSFELDCGDGESYATDFSALFDCMAGTQPTDGFAVTPTGVSFSIASTSTPGELFSCTL